MTTVMTKIVTEPIIVKQKSSRTPASVSCSWYVIISAYDVGSKTYKDIKSKTDSYNHPVKKDKAS